MGTEKYSNNNFSVTPSSSLIRQQNMRFYQLEQLNITILDTYFLFNIIV